MGTLRLLVRHGFHGPSCIFANLWETDSNMTLVCQVLNLYPVPKCISTNRHNENVGNETGIKLTGEGYFQEQK